jgi:hypothetical protein
MISVLDEAIPEGELKQFVERHIWPRRIGNSTLGFFYFVGPKSLIGREPDPGGFCTLCCDQRSVVPGIQPTIVVRQLDRPKHQAAMPGDRRVEDLRHCLTRQNDRQFGGDQIVLPLLFELQQCDLDRHRWSGVDAHEFLAIRLAHGAGCNHAADMCGVAQSLRDPEAFRIKRVASAVFGVHRYCSLTAAQFPAVR